MKKKHIKSAREIKEDKVQDLIEKLGRAKTVAFADYRGLTANQIAELRTKIKSVGGEMLVEKNNLIRLSLKSTKHQISNEDDEKYLTGPTATIFAYDDEIAPIKEVADSNKLLTLPTFKFGFFGHDYLDTSSLEKLSKIPSRDILQAKVVGALNSPIYGIVATLSANLKNLVYALSQIKDQKGA